MFGQPWRVNRQTRFDRAQQQVVTFGSWIGRTAIGVAPRACGSSLLSKLEAFYEAMPPPCDRYRTKRRFRASALRRRATEPLLPSKSGELTTTASMTRSPAKAEAPAARRSRNRRRPRGIVVAWDVARARARRSVIASIQSQATGAVHASVRPARCRCLRRGRSLAPSEADRRQVRSRSIAWASATYSLPMSDDSIVTPSGDPSRSARMCRSIDSKSWM